MQIVTNKDKTTLTETHFDIIYDPVTEKKFQPIQHCFFHGSNIVSWYAIIRNGIKNMSNTALMSAGAAYGPGVYLSSDYSMSFGYSGSNKYFSLSVTGIVQLLNPEKNAKITGVIVVVPDDTQILIRSLIVRTNTKTNTSKNYISNPAKINSYYLKDRIEETQSNNAKILSICGKRLGKEFELIEKKHSKICTFIDSVNDDDRIVWSIKLHNFTNIDLYIIIKFIFSSKYPLEPPIVSALKYPCYDKNDKLFSKNGLIIYDSISPKQWNSSLKLTTVINEIWSLLDNLYQITDITDYITNDINIIDIIQEYSDEIKRKNWIV